MTVRKTLAWSFVLVWMLIIFSFSSQVAKESNRLSNSVSEVVIKIFGEDVDINNNILRKSAHFIIYFILGVLMAYALTLNGINLYKSVIIALLVCFIYAISDEVHQLFINGRSGEVKDILIDTMGAVYGTLFYLCAHFIIKLSNK